MDNYFILSPKEGDKCIRAASNMTSDKLETCILIVETYCLWGGSYHFSLDQRTIIGGGIHYVSRGAILIPSYHYT
jgi:hypothetical protein